MEFSETTSSIFEALSAFQGELDNAPKSKAGHGYKYADLAQCIEVAKPILSKHGLAVTQGFRGDTEAERTIITILTHKSGEWIKSSLIMAKATLQGGAGNNPAQVLGSAITYHRRYAFAAIIGLAQEDDDAASNTPKKQAPAAPKGRFEQVKADLKAMKTIDELIAFFEREDIKAWQAALNDEQRSKVKAERSIHEQRLDVAK